MLSMAPDYDHLTVIQKVQGGSRREERRREPSEPGSLTSR
jgi:hypothetical protein